MKNKKLVSILLSLLMVINMGIPVSAESGVPESATPTELDISKGSITITTAGATGGGLSTAESGLNPNGYRITGSTTVNTVIVETGVTTSVILNDVSIEVGGMDCAIAVESGADVSFFIEETNLLVSAEGAGLGVSSGAKIHIDGTGSLTAASGEESFYAGIGGYEDKNFSNDTLIEINGGIIAAQGGMWGAAGIGGAAQYDGGKIVINGGSITATGGLYDDDVTPIYGIGDGFSIGNNDLRNNGAIIIDGGSVTGIVQNHPALQDAAGKMVLPVKVSVPAGMEGQEFSFTTDGRSWTAAASDKGELCLYLPEDTALIEASAGGNNYQGAVTGTGADRSAALVLYQDDCSCDTATVSVNFEDSEVTVNKWLGKAALTLTAEFEKSPGCTSESHIPLWKFEIEGGVAASEAQIEGNVLTVFYGPQDGSGLTSIPVKATAIVNNHEYSTTANIAVSRTENLEFDLTQSDITLDTNTITYNGETYSVTPEAAVHILGKGQSTDHVLVINGNRTGDVILDNVQMNITNQTFSLPRIKLDMGVDIRIVLVGSNAIFNTGYKDSVSAISIPSDATLTIAGEGSLTVEPKDYPAVGSLLQVGTLIMENGNVTLCGGQNRSAMENLPTGGMISQKKGKVIMKGGLLRLKAGENTYTGGTRPKDLDAELVFDGGSVITDQDIKNGGLYDPNVKNSSDESVYPVTLTMKGSGGGTAISYGVLAGRNNEGTESAPVSTFLDENESIHLFLPVTSNDAWQRVRAWPSNGSSDEADSYYKRLLVSNTEENAAQMMLKPQVELKQFIVPGSISNQIVKNKVEVVIQAGIALDRLKPELVTGYGSETFTVEYLPKGEQDFSGSAETPVEYTLIADNGDETVYEVQITADQIPQGEKTVLNIKDGDIIMESDDRILFGGFQLPANPSGYVITGSSDKHHIVIGNVTGSIEFRDLTVNQPSLTGTGYEEKAPLWINGTDVQIQLTGVNTITGGAGASGTEQPGMLVDNGASVTFTGPKPDADAEEPVALTEGILKLIGGDKNTAASGSGKFIIEGGSIFLKDGAGAPATSLRPRDKDNNLLFALELTVKSEQEKAAAGQSIVYSDCIEETSGAFQPGVTARQLLADESGKVSVYRPLATYRAAVNFNDKTYYGANSVRVGVRTDSGTADAGKAAVIAGLPQLTALNFTDPLTSFGVELPVAVTGTYLGGGLLGAEIIVTAEGGTSAQFPAGNTITETAAFTKKNGWTANLDIPANEDFDASYVYTITCQVDGVSVSTITKRLTMLPRLAITGFSIGSHQIGDEIIQLDSTGKTGTISIRVPYDEPTVAGKPQTYSFTPEITFTSGVKKCTPASGTPREYALANQYTVNYAIYATEYFGIPGESEDEVVYKTTIKPEETPSVTEISFTAPASYLGGDMEVTLQGENLASIRHAVFEQGQKVVISVKDQKGNLVNSCDVRMPEGGWPAEGSGDVDGSNNGSIWKGTVKIPQNDGGQPLEYTISVTINGVEQKLAGNVTVNVPGALEKNAQINSFEFAGIQLDETVISHNASDENGTIAINVPWTTDLSNLAPTITLVNPLATCTPESGDSMDFSRPVEYTVISYDQTVTKVYEVTVTRVANEQEKDSKIYEFNIPDMTEAVIVHPTDSESIGTIEITMPSGTDATALAPEILLGHENATVTPASGQVQDFTEPVRYQVTSVDGTVSLYDVTVTVTKKKKKHPAKPADTAETTVSYAAFMHGHGEGLFGPDQRMTRAEAAALFSNLLSYNGGSDKPSNTADFKDISGNEWYAEYVAFMAEKGIIHGFNGRFRPEDMVTRMEYASMLNKFLELQSDKALKDSTSDADVPFTDMDGAWGKEAVMLLAAQDIVNGFPDGTFRPNQPITRAEATVMALKVLDRPDTEEVQEALQAAGSPFSDVTEAHWAYSGILHAVYDYEITEVSTTVNRKTTVEQKVTVKNKNEK